LQDKIESEMAQPGEQSAVLILNRSAAERLREAATLLSQQQDNPYRVGAYRRAADAVAALDQDLRGILDRGGIEALEQIPGIGRGLAAALAEMVRTGRWAYLERLRGSGEPHDVFCAIPGVGLQLARRLHETLHVETLEQLEAALYDPDAKKVAGIGPRRLSMLRASLAQMLARIRSVRTPPADEPSVDVLLDVDREYRAKIGTDELRTIAPKRFNPKGEHGCRSCIRLGANGTSRLCFPTPPARTSSAKCAIGL
jgi:DNA polymerase (family 10)